MNTKLLEYAPLCSVLRHLEANKRLELVRRCDGLKKVDKNEPLKCQQLCMDDNSLTINHTRYIIAVFVQMDAQLEPIHIKQWNWGGGTHFDIDEQGRHDWKTYDSCNLPGDIQLNLNTSPKGTGDPLKSSFKRVARLTIIHEDGTIQIKQFEYNKMLAQFIKAFNNAVLGQRKCPIVTEKLSLTGDILRLPENVAFKVDELHVRTNIARHFQKVEAILHPSSLPLKRLEFLELSSYDGISANQIVQSAKCLSINTCNHDGGLLAFLQRTKHKMIEIQTETLGTMLYILMVQIYVKEKKREIGSTLILKPYVFDSFLSRIRERFANRQVGEGKYLFDCDEQRCVLVTVQTRPMRDPFETPHIARLEVVRREDNVT